MIQHKALISHPPCGIVRLRMYKGMKLIRFVVLMLAVAMLFSACDDNSHDKIQWQLPLTAPQDPHGGQSDQSLVPEWASAVEGSVKLMFLKTTTAQAFTIEMIKGEKKMFHDWDIQLLGLAKGLRIQNGTFIEDENVHNPAAFVELSLKNEPVYRGWIYQEFPELFGPDTPGWKLWLKAVTVRAPQQEAVQN